MDTLSAPSGTALNTLTTAYIQAFEALTAHNLHSTLAPLLAEDIYFEDPFNRLQGKTQTLRLFEHMFASVEQPRFKVQDSALGRQACAYLYWEFHFFYRGKPRQFDGMSKIEINRQGLVVSHIDYWDPAKHLYSQLPLIGWLLRKIARQLALPENWPTQQRDA